MSETIRNIKRQNERSYCAKINNIMIDDINGAFRERYLLLNQIKTLNPLISIAQLTAN